MDLPGRVTSRAVRARMHRNAPVTHLNFKQILVSHGDYIDHHDLLKVLELWHLIPSFSSHFDLLLFLLP